MKTYWLSFAIRSKGNLGCVITDAPNPEIAYSNVCKANLNPGGKVAIWEMNLNDPAAIREIELFGKNRLITVEELKNGGAKKVGDLTEEEQEKIESYQAARVCQQCNEDPAHAAMHHN